MAYLNSDQDYIDAGLEPPEHNIHGDTTIQPDVHIHEWHQKGNLLECLKGHHPHGHRMPVGHGVLVGTSADGEPVFKQFDFLSNNVDDGDNGVDRANVTKV